MSQSFTRLTAFNVFCQERHKENPQAGLQISNSSLEWRALPDAEKQKYREQAVSQKKIFKVDKCLNNAKKSVQQLVSNGKESMDKGIKSVALVYVKADQIYIYGYGAAEKLLCDPKNIHQIMSSHHDIDERKHAAVLRKKLTKKMSAVADQKLGLQSFPYAKLKRGEYTVSGVPSDLLPLRPPAFLNIKTMKRLLDCNINIFRSNETINTNSELISDAQGDTLSALRTTDNPTTAGIEPDTMSNETINTNSELISDAQGDTLSSLRTTDNPTTAGIEPDTMCILGMVLPSHADLNKGQVCSKRARVTWNTESLSALEACVGPFSALSNLPGSEAIEGFRQAKPVLSRFDVNQIYQKLYKITHKKK